ncbi:MAG TPA: hypothetical protein VFQ44_11895 [Streptosporangiaceae bacterium]|nr:hypothetical protein [Streptosporangiaceae bacterium]
MSEPELRQPYLRFGTAWTALVTAGQLPGGRPIGDLDCLRGGQGKSWWLRADLAIETARELVSVTSGEIYLRSGDELRRDRGWGAPASTGEAVRFSELHETPLLELIRAAGLHERSVRPMSEAVVLLPGYLVAGVARRALDLELEVSYRQVTLVPLFSREPAEPAGQPEPAEPSWTCYAVNLVAPKGAIPAFLVAALDRDPFVLLCRRAGDTVLIQHQLASPLPDGSLASLSGDATWVLAEAVYGCAEVRELGPIQDGTSLVRRGSDHELNNLDDLAGWAEPAGASTEPAAPALTLVPASMTGVPVDAALLDDADLACLPMLLAGEPLAEAAMLVRGRDRHLLTAAGGLLEELPAGEPLYCIGPGSLYLPLGYRLQPRLPPTARRTLYPAGGATAIVVVPDGTLGYDLTTRVPVWTLWTGPDPEIDYQVPASVVTDLEALDDELTARPAGPAPAPKPAKPAQPRPVTRIDRRPAPAGPPRTWRDQAYEAELAGDFACAAEIHANNNDPLRAARLYERAAGQS